MTDEIKASAKQAEKEPEWAPTLLLRHFHPVGQIATGRRLQQLWTRGDEEEWRDVPVFNEE